MAHQTVNLELTIFVQRRFVDHFTSVVDELLTKLLRQFVLLAPSFVAVIDVVLHVSQQRGIRPIEEGNRPSRDISINGGESSENDVEVHEQSVLAGPVPRRVEESSFERVNMG